MSGKLIVFEGTDGSGKATQSQLLRERLEREGTACRKIDFPRYGKPSAAMVEAYLRGDFGSHAEDVNAYAASLFFAMDRYASYREDWGDFYRAGGLIVADRYTTSNAVHQASKLPREACREYLAWLFDTEYRLLGLPKPDLVLYLDMPTEITRAMRHHREEETGSHADIHEQDEAYLRRCRESGAEVARDCGWQVISCAENGAARSLSSIHEEIYARVRELLKTNE